MSFWNSKLIVDNINYLYANGEDLSYMRMCRERGDVMASASRILGSWKEAVEAAGIDYEKFRKYKIWTNEKIISEIRKRHSENKPLNYRQMYLEELALLTAATRKQRFGSWDEALKAAGLEPKNVRKCEYWDDKRVKTEIRKLFRKGIALNQRSIKDVFPRLLAAASNHFGSWRNAVIATGFKYDKIVLRRRMTRDEILKELKGLHKKGVRLSEINTREKYSRLRTSATREFGTWTKAKQAIGDFSNYRIKWTKETVIKEIKKLHKKGVILTKKHMLKENIGLYCASRYPRNFGSWPEARRAAGIKGYGEESVRDSGYQIFKHLDSAVKSQNDKKMNKRVSGLDKKLLSQIVDLILKHKKLEKIVIFGSRVSGDFKNTSDIDIAIFGKDWTDKDINIVKYNLDEFIKTPIKFDLLNFYRIGKTKLKENILKEGRIIYDIRKD